MLLNSSTGENDILRSVNMQRRHAPSRPRGRRPAGSGTRDAILETARQQFGERGYRATTLRKVGDAAGVDPRLVLHYFGSKQHLFIESVRLPVDPDVLLARLFEPGPGSLGERAAALVLTAFDDVGSQRALVGIIRAAASEPEAAGLIRELLTTRLLMPIAQHIGTTQPRLRASMVASQVVGLAMARHVVGIEPLETTSNEQIAAAIAPVFDHYLSGDWVDATEDDQPSGVSPS